MTPKLKVCLWSLVKYKLKGFSGGVPSTGPDPISVSLTNSSLLTGESRKLAREAFCSIARQVTSVNSKDKVYKLFGALHGAVSLSNILVLVPTLNEEQMCVVQSGCHWDEATAWVAWWTRPNHLKMLCKPFTDVNDDVWDRAPKDTNAVERMNRLSKTPGIIPSLYIAMESLYKKDKALLLQHIAASEKCKTSYRSSAEQEKRESARSQRQKQQIKTTDKNAQFGPPDKRYHFESLGESGIVCDQDSDCETSDSEAPRALKQIKTSVGSGKRKSKGCAYQNKRKDAATVTTFTAPKKNVALLKHLSPPS